MNNTLSWLRPRDSSHQRPVHWRLTYNRVPVTLS